MSIQDQAIQIATNSLRACYVANGIIAGPHHFTDYWARDGFFAAFGSLAIGDVGIVQKMLAMFFSYQRLDGLIPYRIMRGPISLNKYFGKPKLYSSPHPTYRLRGLGQDVYDGTTLSLLFAALLKEKKYLPQVKQALIYLESVDPILSTTLTAKATQIADSLRSRLWNSKYFADWHDYVTS